MGIQLTAQDGEQQEPQEIRWVEFNVSIWSSSTERGKISDS